MAAPTKLNLKIYQGSTFEETFRWESGTKVYVPITGISKSAPIVITAPAHGIPVGWRGRITNAGGMKEVNALDYNIVTGTTTDTVTFNQVNSLAFTTYTSGGVLEYNQPVPLTGLNARMQLRKSVSSADILYSTDTSEIVLDLVLETISINIPASKTQNLQFTAAVYSLELYNTAGLVIPFLTGNVSVIPEIAR